MSHRKFIVMSILAIMFAAAGCSDESSENGASENEGGCSPECTTGYHCDGGVCKEDAEPSQPGKTTEGCDKCTETQVCASNRCEECENIICDNKCCNAGEICDEGACRNPCDSCTGSQICTENGCEACPNVVCSDGCCNEGEACDLFTGECAETKNGKAACNGIFCSENWVCTENGFCALTCEDGELACGPSLVCCADGKKCHQNLYCRVVCDETQTLCGKEEEEVCCDQGYVCEEDKCLIACDGTRCGENQDLCCDNTSEVCAFNHCVKPTSENTCKTDDDCDLWSFCDTGASRCIAQDEDTNACIYRPPVGEFKPKVKWHWTNGTGVHGTPIVINLTDDNEDGKIDENDIPEVVTNTNNGEIAALDGATGKPWAISAKSLYNSCDDIAAADIDNDGIVEVLVPNASTAAAKGFGLAILNLVRQDDETYEWVQKHFIPAENYSTSTTGSFGIDLHPTVMDIDSDGKPDIVTTAGIIRGDGDWSGLHCKLDIKGSTNWAYYDLFAVGDLDQDGNAEIISEAVYDKDCNVLIPKEGRWLYSAYADMVPDDNDPANPGELVPEIVRVGNGRVSVWKVYKNGDKWSQKLVWDKPQTSTSGGGNPVIADFDGDGNPDIGVAGRTHLTVFNGQTGDIVWASQTQDKTSEKTGASVFDFEGDGTAEVVYRDEVKIRIYAGPGAGKDEAGKAIDKDNDGYMDGKILWEEPKTSGTIIDYPLIVDVDNDGRTEIVISSNIKDWTPAGMDVGITVYSDTYDNWVRTRRIWNEHAYHVTNINENGSVPSPEPANWLNRRLNNYRANVQPSSGFNAPNFQPNGLKMSLDDCEESGNIIVTADVKNAGSIGVSAPVAVSFYIADYEYEGNKYMVYLGTSLTSGTISAGGTASVTFAWNGKGTIVVNDNPVEIDVKGENLKMTYIVDDANKSIESYIPFNECHEEDNTGLSDVIEYCPTIVY